MRYLMVKNWTQFQHYRHRSPPWIKLHQSLLNDYEFTRLQDASKAHLMLIWLFASQNDGRIPEDAKFLQRRIGLEKAPDLESLVFNGFLIPEQSASNTIADGKQVDSNLLDRDRDRDRVDRLAGFPEFWAAYPRKVAKPRAVRAWKQIAPSAGELEKLMQGLAVAKTTDQWTKDGGKFIPHPATWLSERRWEDEGIEEQPRRFVV